MANNTLEDHTLEAQCDIIDAATKAMLAVSQSILHKHAIQEPLVSKHQRS